MELKERLRKGLEFSREFTERLLQDFTEPQHWMESSSEGGNHALWIAGHLGVAEDFFAGLAGGETDVRDEYRKLFGKGSTPLSDISSYPDPQAVLDYMRERRASLLASLDACEDFDKETPEGAPFFMNDLGAMFQMIVWHESLHSGQLTSIRRQLGHDPVA